MFLYIDNRIPDLGIWNKNLLRVRQGFPCVLNGQTAVSMMAVSEHPFNH